MRGLLEAVRAALASIIDHKMRAGLTVLGVVIGVATIIAMQSVIAGLQGTVESQLGVLGANAFQVQKYPAIRVGGHDANREYRNRADLTVEHARRLQRAVTLGESVAAEKFRFGVSVASRDERTDPAVLLGGVEAAYGIAKGISVEYGRFLTDDDVRYHRRVVVLGPDVVAEVFPFGGPLGKTVRIDAQPFEVIGVLESQGTTFGQSQDNCCFIPISRFEDVYGAKGSVSMTVRVPSTQGMDSAQDEVIGILRALRHVAPGRPNDFDVWSSSGLTDDFNDMTAMVRAAAIGVASVSLLVAGIGIMNIMMVSVTERTREIGVRKAVGATEGEVLRQFIVEAVVLTELGALLGILFGLGVGWAVRASTPVPAVVPTLWIPGAFGFCSVVGLVFGIYPALRASRLDPIEALRHE